MGPRPPPPPPPGRGQRPAAEEHFELLATPAAMATTVDGDAGRFKPYACDAATGMGVSPGGGGGLYPNASIQQYPLIPFRNVFLVTEIARRPRKTTKKIHASPNCNCCIDRPERRPHRLPPRLRTDGTTTTMPNTKKWKPMVSNEATRCA